MPSNRILPHRYLLIIFFLTALLFAAFTMVLYKQATSRDAYTDWTIHSYEVLRQSRLITNNLLDMETGQRGYLLTHAKEFLTPYNRAIRTMPIPISRLQLLLLDNPQQVVALGIISQKIQLLIQIFKSQIAQVQNPTGETLRITELQRSRILMDEIRQSLDQFAFVEQNLLTTRSIIARQEQREYFSVLMIGACLGIGGLLIATLVILGLIARNRKAEAALEQTRETYEMLLENLNDGMYDYRPLTGKITYSISYLRMLGYKSDEIEKSVAALSELIHPEDYKIAHDTFQKYANHEIPAYNVTFRMRHKNGQWRWVLSRGVGSWNKKDELVRLLGLHTDITGQKQHEEELRQLNADLENFIYITSHDLRAPLVNIKGFAGEIHLSLEESMSLLSQAITALPAEAQSKITTIFTQDIPEALSFIKSGVERMDMLTIALLDLSRIGRREFNYTEVDTNALVTRCLNSLAYDITTKDIEISLKSLPEIVCDPMALEQIFGNLLDNAIKYLHPDRKGIITVSAYQLPWETQFSIKDNGRGIAEKDFTRIFDIFRRAGNAGDVRGIGMGMAFVKTLIRRCGGKIWFESTLNEGSSFHFSIPTKSIHSFNPLM